MYAYLTHVNGLIVATLFLRVINILFTAKVCVTIRLIVSGIKLQSFVGKNNVTIYHQLIQLTFNVLNLTRRVSQQKQDVLQNQPVQLILFHIAMEQLPLI